MEQLKELCGDLEKFGIYKYDFLVYLDKTFFDSENTFDIQKDMFDCLTFVNTILGYILMDIIYEISLSTDSDFFIDLPEITKFLYDALSPMTKLM
jgi:hypothetical protein